MISYRPFWATLKAKEKTTYFLINKCNMSPSIITRLKRNEGISTQTLDQICQILQCKAEDVIEIVLENKPSQN